MTQIITAITNKSILMASDTRANYNIDEIENGQKFMKILAIADCCRKTFFLMKAKIGIQFIGNGYLKEGDSKRHLNYFIPIIQEGIIGDEPIESKMHKIFSNLRKITTSGDTENYVNGVMTGYWKNEPYLCTFNTFNEDDKLLVQKVESGNFVDSENYIKNISKDEEEAIKNIIDAIKNVSKTKLHLIGDEIEILKIEENSGSYIQEGKKLFFGTQLEFLKHFENESGLSGINGKLLDVPVKEKIKL